MGLANRVEVGLGTRLVLMGLANRVEVGACLYRRAVAARSEVVRLNSSVGLGAGRKNARVARCCRGVHCRGVHPQENFGISGLLRWFLMQFLGKNVATGVYIARSATVATVLSNAAGTAS